MCIIVLSVLAKNYLFYETSLELNKKTPKKTWNTLNDLMNRNVTNCEISEILTNTGLSSEPSKISETFNEFFTLIGPEISNAVPKINTDPLSYMPQINDDIKFDIGNFSPSHIVDLLKTMPNKASNDFFGINMRLIKHVMHPISVPLSHIFNLSLNSGHFPKKFKLSRTVPIFKTGNPNDVDNYRPISLVCTLSKILEKMVATNLINYLQINKLIHPHQFGFQRNISTEHNLIHVINYISQAINKGNYCVGVFFDLKKAFDVVDHKILLKKLEKLGVKENCLKWFESYLSNRKQIVDINGYFSSERDILCSVLQGSSLGPILFLCFINDFPLCTNMISYLFADDTSCLDSDKCLNSLFNRVNTELQKISNWYCANKLAVNIQ